ncbi:MAG: carboxymuconolactone decarboxylase family protein, partial [Acidimicrobiaceae bacterium]|nr:carboxymuconolactone decarboxylase family protein [Acidimicrobiaceae bacterium]
MQQGLEEDLYQQVSDYATSGAFSDAEKLAAQTAERFCWTHEAMMSDEDYWARMKEHFTDQQILE